MRLSLYSLLVFVSLLSCSSAKELKTISITQLEKRADGFYQGTKKYTGFAYGSLNKNNRTEKPFANFIRVPYNGKYPLNKLNRVDSIYASINEGKLKWVKAYINKEAYAICRQGNEGEVLYSFYGIYRNRKKEVDTTVFSYQFSARNDTLNGLAQTWDYNYSTNRYEKRNVYSFENGLPSGEGLWYYPSNEDGVQILKNKKYLLAGKRHGPDSSWFKSGKLQAVYQYKEGEKINYSLLFYADGQSIRDSSLYEDGEEVAYYAYTYNGLLYAQKVYGKFEVFPLSGEVVIEQNGRLVYKSLNNETYQAYGEGKILIKDYDGRLLEVWHFRNGKKHGRHIQYNFDGSVSLEEEWLEGTRINLN